MISICLTHEPFLTRYILYHIFQTAHVMVGNNNGLNTERNKKPIE